MANCFRSVLDILLIGASSSLEPRDILRRLNRLGCGTVLTALWFFDYLRDFFPPGQERETFAQRQLKMKECFLYSS